MKGSEPYLQRLMLSSSSNFGPTVEVHEFPDDTYDDDAAAFAYQRGFLDKLILIEKVRDQNGKCVGTFGVGFVLTCLLEFDLGVLENFAAVRAFAQLGPR